MPIRSACVLILGLFLLVAGRDVFGAESDLEASVRRLEGRIASLESRIDHQRRELEEQRTDIEEAAGIMGYVSFLFGTVFALWAQNRNRSALGWFVCGVIPVLNIFAAFNLLFLNRVHIEAGKHGGS